MGENMLEKPNRKKIDKQDGNTPTNIEQLIQRYDLEKVWPYIEDIIENLNEINIKDLTEFIDVYKDVFDINNKNVAIGQKYDTEKGGKFQVNGNIRADKLIGNLEGTADKVKINSRNTTDTWIPIVRSGYLDYTTRYIPNQVTHSQHNNEQDRLATLNMLSFWNGAYNGNGASNLTYCYQGTIQAKPKVLYNNSSGTNGTVTLNETAANFAYLEIFYSFNGGHFSKKISSPNSKNIILDGMMFTNNTTSYNFTSFYYINATSVSLQVSYSGQFSRSYSTGAISGNNSTSNVKIHQIIGYR